MLNLVSKAITAIANGAQKAAASLAAVVPAQASRLAALPIQGLETGTKIAKFSLSGAASAGGAAIDLSSFTMGGAGSQSIAALVRSGKLVTDATDTTKYLMGQPMGGGGGGAAQAAANANANSNAMASAAAARMAAQNN